MIWRTKCRREQNAKENQKGTHDNLGIDQLMQLIFQRTGSHQKVRAKLKLLSIL
jgi:hypothetical protein